MITTKISKKDFEWQQRPSNEFIKVATLDGQPILKGVAICAYDLEERSGYIVYYQRVKEYYSTFVQLRTPSGKLVKGYAEGFDFSLVYAAERPGKYPDDAETFERFVQAKQTFTPIGNKKNFPAYVRNLIQEDDDIIFVHRYPGNLWMTEDVDDHGDRFACLDLNYVYEQFYTGDLEQAEDYLFDMFMLYGNSF
ncbi:hypothetical protein [Chitinophaga arvensicola]|uniref:Uncharacterized protein n=1 Tax=Chitinophaga arvensicola TaxID=29529 RepID=A0A1I0PQM3_9BACT|nr:hypothetical protein [Chitinophaga arvensicola]SEW16591.1 hypothetical protein SAMN04488122_0913 [Chitinophaga arvensicola]